MDYENKIVKKQKTTTRWITCLNNIRVSRVLQLIELFPDGLIQRDIFSILDAPRDKGIMQALIELEYHGFIKREIKSKPSIQAIDSVTEIKGRKMLIDIKYGLDTKRERYIIQGNPIEKMFDKLLEEEPLLKTNKNFLLIKKDISNRWKMMTTSYSFNSKYLTKNSEETYKQTTENLNKASELYKGEQLEQARKDRDKIIEDLKRLKEEETEIKKQKQIELINGLRLKTETHIDYVTLQLQRILIEMFIYLYANLYQVKETNIDTRLIETIEQLLYAIEPSLQKVAMIDEVTTRIKNFKNLIEMKTLHKRLKTKA